MTSAATATPPSTTSQLATLAHVYANVQVNATMLQPAGETLRQSRGGLSDELHTQYSFIAVLILMSLFLTVTVSATGLLLTFCKKKNSVFSLQKCEQDSQFEMDDLDNTETESCLEDTLAADVRDREVQKGGGKRRSQTYPVISAAGIRDGQRGEVTFKNCGPANALDSPRSAPAPLDPKDLIQHPWDKSFDSNQLRSKSRSACKNEITRTVKMGKGSLRRSLTVAAIHQTNNTAKSVHNVKDCYAQLQDGDVHFTGGVSAASAETLALQIDDYSHSQESLETFALQIDDYSHSQESLDSVDGDLDDIQNDQTVALLRC